MSATEFSLAMLFVVVLSVWVPFMLLICVQCVVYGSLKARRRFSRLNRESDNADR